LARTVVFATVSRTKTSCRPFVSPATRFDARLSNATKRPFPLTTGLSLALFACTSVSPTLTRTVDVHPAAKAASNNDATTAATPDARTNQSVARPNNLALRQIADQSQSSGAASCTWVAKDHWCPSGSVA